MLVDEESIFYDFTISVWQLLVENKLNLEDWIMPPEKEWIHCEYTMGIQ